MSSVYPDPVPPSLYGRFFRTVVYVVLVLGVASVVFLSDARATHVDELAQTTPNFAWDYANQWDSFTTIASSCGPCVGNETIISYNATESVNAGDYYMMVTLPAHDEPTTYRFAGSLLLNGEPVFGTRAGGAEPSACGAFGLTENGFRENGTTLVAYSDALNSDNDRIYVVKGHINFTSLMTWTWRIQGCGNSAGFDVVSGVNQTDNRIRKPDYVQETGDPTAADSVNFQTSSSINYDWWERTFVYRLYQTASIDARQTPSQLEFLGTASCVSTEIPRCRLSPLYWAFSSSWSPVPANNTTIELFANSSSPRLDDADVAGHLTICVGAQVQTAGGGWALQTVTSNQFGTWTSNRTLTISDAGTLYDIYCGIIGPIVDGDLINWTATQAINMSIFVTCTNWTNCNSDPLWRVFVANSVNTRDTPFDCVDMDGTEDANPDDCMMLAWTDITAVQSHRGMVRSSFDDSLQPNVLVEVLHVGRLVSSNSTGNFTLDNLVGQQDLKMSKTGFETKVFDVTIAQGSTNATYYLNETTTGRTAVNFGPDAAAAPSVTGDVRAINLSNAAENFGEAFGLTGEEARNLGGIFLMMIIIGGTAILTSIGGITMQSAIMVFSLMSVLAIIVLSIVGVFPAWIAVVTLILAAAVGAIAVFPSGGGSE